MCDTYKLEHVVDIFGRDGHAIVLDEEETVSGGSVENLVGDFG
jgi:hypothetical protein